MVIKEFILAAFQKFGSHSNSLVTLFNGHVEIGSPASKDAIIAEAENARLVFTREPERLHVNNIAGRRGGIFFNYEIVGVTAHSGVSF